MRKMALYTGATYGLLTVLIGAFGAHALKSNLLEYGRLETFETAVKYQVYHALLLVIIGFNGQKLNARWFKMSVYSITIGVFIFSGSLYLLSILNTSKFGAITPVGGLFLIIGWIGLILSIKKDQ
ncbi:MAG: DUF423 domain-containing protein [Reichenbachiella sp.]